MRKAATPAQPLDWQHAGPPLIMSPLSGGAPPGRRTSFEPLTDTPPSGVPSEFVEAGEDDDARIAETTPMALARLRRPRALKGDR